MLRRLLKFLLWTTITLVALLVLVVLFHPPLVKWAVKRYSPEYTGRQITLDHFRVNPFTGNVHMEGLHVLEAKADTVFVHINAIDVNTTLYKMWSGFYEITSVTIDGPFLRIVQSGDRFNFSDLSDRFASDTALAPEPTDSEPMRYAVQNIALNDGTLNYLSDLLPKPVHVRSLQFTSTGLAWDKTLVEALASLSLANGSTLSTEVRFDQQSLKYEVHADLDKVPLKMFAPYVQPYLRISAMDGLMQADMHVRGNGNDPMDVGLKGRIQVQEAQLLDPDGVKLTGLGRMEVVIDSIDVKQELYRIRRFTLHEPYVFYEMYDEDDNWTRLMAPDTVASSVAAEAELGYDPMNPFSMLVFYAKEVAASYTDGNYKVDSLGIGMGTVIFNDYTLQNTFHYALTDLSITANGINSKQDSITLFAHSALNGSGTFDARADLDPATLRNMHFSYTIDQLGMPDFGPYTVFFLAHPILSGTTRYTCETHIVNNKLVSKNHILVEDFQFGRKMDVSTAYQLPMRLAVSLLKDKDGNIDLELPVEGDLDDPEYKVMPIVWQVLKNLIVKAVSAPINLLSRAFDADEEDLKAVRFLHLQEDLTGKQEKPLNTLARVASAKPELKIELVQAGDKAGEEEAYALLMARSAFLADSTGAPVDLPRIELEEKVRTIDIKSPGFTAWLDKRMGASSEPTQKRCMQFVGAANAKAEVERLWAARKVLLETYLTTTKQLPAGRITVRDATPEDKVATSGQPYFQVLYGSAPSEE
ncbi:MAG: DUF748 domain-containing protein [Flavobacteriales bacterium]|nr:DUF748 domain-containing protein [Flavobacteriales bacterium]MBK9289963.1 DUF748 domain-containing protein [Flavobacteriales bacterium]